MSFHASARLTCVLSCTIAAVVMLIAAAAPAVAAEFTDAAGRRVILPDPIGRILPAEQSAEVLVYVLAPEKLAALEPTIAAGGSRLPRGAPSRTLRWRPRLSPASMAET